MRVRSTIGSARENSQFANQLSSALLSSALLVALTSGCGAPAFPKDLFTVAVPDADYPVMLSDTTPSNAKQGRPITAESGMSASQSQSSYSTGNTTVTVTTTTAAQSEMPASEKLGAKVRRSETWIKVERATFSAVDFATYGAASTERLLTIDATAYK